MYIIRKFNVASGHVKYLYETPDKGIRWSTAIKMANVYKTPASCAQVIHLNKLSDPSISAQEI